MNNINVTIKSVKSPLQDNSKQPIMLTEKTMLERKNKLLANMKKKGISAVLVYADKEHGGSFEYLTGFIPRFEEALLLLNSDGKCTLLLGNENFNKAKFSLTPCDAILCPLFSLPNQPMDRTKTVKDYLEEVEIDRSGLVGVVDWKLLSNDYDDLFQGSAMPSFMMDAIREVISAEKLVNATGLFIHPQQGARVTNNANEIAHYEYGASLASDAILEGLNHLSLGVSELELGDILQKDGQLPNVVSIAAFGPRFENANIYPRNKKLEHGETVALTVSHKGGLSSRSGYAVNNRDELDQVASRYLEEMAFPYFRAYVYWLKNVAVGKNGGAFYQEFEERYPQQTYGWELNPGHLTADEEWLSSPFYQGSQSVVKSGMIFAVDFIPQMNGLSGISAESTVAVADETLRNDIQTEHPDLWERIVKRRAYMKDHLGIELGEDLLPLASTLGYYRPFLLNADDAFVIEG